MSKVYDWDARAWVPVFEAWTVNFRPSRNANLTITRVKHRGAWRTVRIARYGAPGPDRWITYRGVRLPVALAFNR